jgi:hypothetical protein
VGKYLKSKTEVADFSAASVLCYNYFKTLNCFDIDIINEMVFMMFMNITGYSIAGDEHETKNSKGNPRRFFSGACSGKKRR